MKDKPILTITGIRGFRYQPRALNTHVFRTHLLIFHPLHTTSVARERERFAASQTESTITLTRPQHPTN